MASRERRRETPATARVALIVLANLAALFYLLALFGGASGEPVSQAAEPEVPAAPLTESEQRMVSAGVPRILAPRNPSEPDSARDQGLQQRLEKHIAKAVREASKRSKNKVHGNNCRVAISVLDVGGGHELVSRLASKPLRPASNMKLVTSAAALVSMGSEGRFETRFETSGDLNAGLLDGDLIVRAGGDPFFDPAGQGQVARLFAPAAKAIRQAGIQVIQGDLRLDQGTFLTPGPAPGWPASNQYWQEHCALASGFTANASCLTAVVKPRKVGAPAFAVVRPNLGGLARAGSVKTGSAKSRLNIAVGATASKATLKGSIPSSARSWNQRFSHPRPSALFSTALLDALREEGVVVRGKVRLERNVPPGKPLTTLHTPIVDVLAPINAESNNAVADQLFFAMGDQVGGAGTRAGGLRAVQQALKILDVSNEGFWTVDGSGLSRDDRVTPRQLSGLLAAVLSLDGRSAELFQDSLAVAGRGGSLAQRMKGTPAEGRTFAKTGWIRGTSALSGYVETLSGDLLCFSILVEYPDFSGLNTHCWKPMEDAICVELVQWKRPENG